MNNGGLYLIRATEKDVDVLFEWVNDKETRQNAFDSHIISYEEHTAWFRKVLTDSQQLQYILMLDDKPIGQVRLTIDDQDAEIDYSISNKERGKGYGACIVSLIVEKVKEDCPNVRKLVGKVKTKNVASYHCFLKNGFEEAYRQLEFVISNY